jgi:tRNA pseudouridine38-40 synthase
VVTVCAGRTDSGVHALNQVVHLDTRLHARPLSWVRGTNTLPAADVAVQWCQPVGRHFHARNSARGRRYRFVVLQSVVRPALEPVWWAGSSNRCTPPPCAKPQPLLVGEHDFSSFRAAGCQSPTPVKTVKSIRHQPAWCVLVL